MIVPSIDLMGGRAVQLVGGRQLALEAGDPRPIARRFGTLGEIAVVDLDAALGAGSNAELIQELLVLAPCRVGGGIRDVETARTWLDAGATKVVLGTAAVPEVLRELPRDRVVAALDAVHGSVVVEGWQRDTGVEVAAAMEKLRPYVSEFLVTFVEREGRLQGIDPGAVARLVEAAGGIPLTVAGGVTTAEEIAALDAIGVNAQVGMALYTGKLHPGDALTAPLVSDRDDGLWPTVVTDERGVALGLAWSSAESVRAAVDEQVGIYHSRRRGLWRKGETSGARQELVRIEVDCDRDALRFAVHQQGGFCHTGSRSCFGDEVGLGRLQSTVLQRAIDAPAGSYTRQLLDNGDLLAAKLAEEAGELAEAEERGEVIHEAADLLYFTLVKLAAAGVSLSDVEDELDRRSVRVRRREEV
jgi:phosphoribosyl-ATP pyrophosphohydrolase